MKSILFVIILTFLSCESFAFAENWSELEDGLDYLLLEENMIIDSSEANAHEVSFKVHIIRINTELYSINVYGNFQENNENSYSLARWLRAKNLLLAINASMYLPDLSTSTGYMRAGNFENNGRIANAMSGFFLSEPRNPNLPLAQIIDRNTPNWETLIEQYSHVVQNFRILGNYNTHTASSEIMWAQSETRHPIAAIADDSNNMIYFIFSEKSSSVYELGHYLLSLREKNINFRTVLYTEGGSESGLGISTQSKRIVLSGMTGSSFLQLPLIVPNIIGVIER